MLLKLKGGYGNKQRNAGHYCRLFFKTAFFDLRDLKQKIFTCVCPEEAAMKIQTAAVSSWLYEFPKRHFLFGL